MAGPTVGLDIGSNLIKVVEARRGNNGVQITALGMTPTPPEAMENGIVVDPVLLGQKVKELLKQAGVSSRKCVSSVSGQSVVVRVIDMPRVKPADLNQQMSWEVERQVPFAVTDVVMDYQAIDRPGTENDPNMEVLLAVAQQATIDQHIEMLKAAGLKPVAIDVEPLAICRSLLDLAGNGHRDPNHTVAIINIGAGATDIGIYRDNLLSFPRTLPIAGNNLTHAIAAGLGVDLATAEGYKRQQGEVLVDQVAQSGYGAPAPDFGGGFHDFTQTAPPPAPASGRMPFDFSTPSDAPPPFGAEAGYAAPDEGGYMQPPAAPPPADPGFMPPGGYAAPPPEFGVPGAEPAPDYVAPPTANLPATTDEAIRVQVFNSMAPVLTELATEIRRSLEYYRGKTGDAPIHEVLLCGGSAKLNGLDRFLETELGVPVKVADPLHVVQVTTKNYSAESLNEMASLFPVSIGLAARDLIPGQSSKKR